MESGKDKNWQADEQIAQMKKLKVCLAFPRTKYVSGDPPLGVAYLASYLQKYTGADVNIIDTTFSRSLGGVSEELKVTGPDILGIYSDAIMMKNAIYIADWAQNEKIYTVFGGPQPTVAPEFFIGHSDAVVLGEGELPLRAIVERFQQEDLSTVPGIWWKRGGDLIKNTRKEIFMDLKEQPFPKRELLPMKQYLYNWNYLDTVGTEKRGTTMMVSRGCPFSCRYCQPTIKNMFGEKIRFRSPENVVEEIKDLKSSYDIDGIFFHDDTLTVNHSWLKEFCGLLIEKGIGILWGCNSRVDTVSKGILEMMHEAGLRVVHFGIESGSQTVLDEIYDKKIKLEQAKDAVYWAQNTGIHTMGFFMLGAPQETEKEINKTICFASRLQLEEATFSLTTPLKGTYLADTLSNNSGYNIDHQDFNYYSKYAIKGGISRSRMKFLQIKALLSFYLRRRRLKYILKHFVSIRGIKKLLNKVRRFF